MNENDEYFLADMSEEEKDDLIRQLAGRYNTATTIAVSLHNTLETIAAALLDHDVLGSRGPAMREMASRMRIVAAITRSAMGIDEEQIQQDMEFDDIISRLED